MCATSGEGVKRGPDWGSAAMGGTVLVIAWCCVVTAHEQRKRATSSPSWTR